MALGFGWRRRRRRRRREERKNHSSYEQQKQRKCFTEIAVFSINPTRCCCCYCSSSSSLRPLQNSGLFFFFFFASIVLWRTGETDRATERTSDRRPQRPRNVVLRKKAGEARRWTSIRFLDVRDWRESSWEILGFKGFFFFCCDAATVARRAWRQRV